MCTILHTLAIGEKHQQVAFVFQKLKISINTSSRYQIFSPNQIFSIFQFINPGRKPHNNQLLNLNKYVITNENKGNPLLRVSEAKHMYYVCTTMCCEN